LGESRPQELWRKAAALELAAARWHLVGHLQRNKVRRTLPLVSLIHSVDSERLMAEIDREAAALGKTANVLMEVNTSGEAQKHGLAPDEVEPLLTRAAAYPHVSIHGLMTMASLEGGIDTAARNFAALRDLRNRVQSNLPGHVRLDELSMGMSGDFEAAIVAGATLIRVGSLLWEGC
jgi:pyridoxal phosphate enzyme (YggS family)